MTKEQAAELLKLLTAMNDSLRDMLYNIDEKLRMIQNHTESIEMNTRAKR